MSRQPHILPEALAFDSSTRGQAVLVKLSDGKNVVALLASGPRAENSNYAATIVQRVFKVPPESIPGLRGRRELSPNQMPTLITVTSPNDAATAHVISPESFDSVLGAHLLSISIEMTTDPVTVTDIDTQLPFLVNEEKQRPERMNVTGFTPRYALFVRR